MTNGIAIGLCALAGIWLGWYALPIALSMLVIIQVVEQRRNVGLILVCGIIIIAGAARSQAPVSTTTTPELTASTGAIGKINSFPIPSGEGHRAQVLLSDVCVLDQCIEADTQVLVYFPDQWPPISRGQVVRVEWRFDSLQELPSGYRSFVSSQGAKGSARATNVETISDGNLVFQGLAISNRYVSSQMEHFLPGDSGALGTGIVTGDDSRLSPATEADFRATGTSHITAVSGQNVTLILGFLSMWYRPKTVPFRLLFHTILLLTVWSFALFVGLETPVLRAAIVASFSIAGSHVGRKSDPVTLLALTIGIISFIQPLSVHAVGFWLSATASMALCLALPRKRSGDAKLFLKRILGAPAVASVATMPISLMAFGVWSPIGILTNILVAPVITIAFPVTYIFVLLATFAPPIAGELYWLPNILLEIVLVIVSNMATVAMQLRIDTASPLVMGLIWLPIIIGIWLSSNESQRWIRRILIYSRTFNSSSETAK